MKKRANSERVEAIKKRVAAVSRLKVAIVAGMSYDVLTRRITGYMPLTEEVAEKIERALDIVEAGQLQNRN